MFLEREALRATLKSAAPSYHAPPELRPSIMRALRATQQQRTPPGRAASWWQVAAYAGVAAATSALPRLRIGRNCMAFLAGDERDQA